MSTFEVMQQSFKFNRGRTLALCDEIAKLPNPQAALAFRPGPGRAHLAWQLMHIGVTEELFASERLAPDKPGKWTELWPRFRGGSKPDDNIPGLAEIRELLAASRERLLETLATFNDDRLGEIPAALAERKLTMRDVLFLLSWHESHHQGQAHATLNAYKAAG